MWQMGLLEHQVVQLPELESQLRASADKIAALEQEKANAAEQLAALEKRLEQVQS